MPQDAFSLNYLCQELNSILKDGKINKIIQPDNDTIILTVYTGERTEKLYISVSPSCPRIGIVNGDIEASLVAPNFCMLLRKHLLSASIEKISLVGFDRIVKIDFIPYAEFFDSEKRTLYVELMGRYSNVILTENDKILGCNRGVNFFDNGVRPLLVGKKYVTPPVGKKKEPTNRRLIEYFSQFKGENLANYIFEGVQGIALSTAQEISSSFVEKAANNFAINFFNHLNDFLFFSKRMPCVIIKENAVVDVCVYPYKTLNGQAVYFENLYQAEQFFFSEKNKDKEIKSNKNRLENIVQTRLKKLKKKLSNLTSDERSAQTFEDNKIKGELILANYYNIRRGQPSCSVYDYYNNQMVEIPLDIELSPSKNAERYFKKYNKQKRTLEFVSEQKAVVLKEIEYIQSLVEQIALSENNEEIDSVKHELEELGLLKKSNTRAKVKELGCRKYQFEGFVIKAGRNNLENDKITFSANAKDLWLHSKDYHSSHIIIESNGREIPSKVIEFGAEICAYYSKARNSGKTEVVYTLKKNVKKPPKSKPGFCTYDNFSSITVIAKKHAEFSKNT